MISLQEIQATNSIKSLRNIHRSNGYISFGINLYKLFVTNLYDIKMDFDVQMPKYQMNLQRPYVWTIEQQRELILSMLYERSIPPVVIINHENKDGSRTYQVIDGKQRLMTIKRFMENEFPIILNGFEVYYSDLEHDAARKIFSANILMECWYSYYDEPITDEEKIIIFNFYNFAGTPQEISHKQKLLNIIK